MKITIESTDMKTNWRGVECRVWRGVTENGARCDLAIPVIRVHESQDSSLFDTQLRELPPPTEAVNFRSIW